MFLIFDTIAVPIERIAVIKLAHYWANPQTGKNDVIVYVEFRGADRSQELVTIGQVPAGANAWEESQKLFQAWAKAVLPQSVPIKDEPFAPVAFIGGCEPPPAAPRRTSDIWLNRGSFCGGNEMHGCTTCTGTTFPPT